jgi:WD40 repeat protein
LVKAYKSLDQLLCISDCSRTHNCKLISFNKSNNECKYYNGYLNNVESLIESNGDFVYDFQISNSRYTYKLQGIQHVSLSTGYCRVHSLISLPNGNFASGCDAGLITIWSTIRWDSILTFNHGTWVLCLAILQNNYLISAGSGNNIKIWDYKVGKLINTYYGFSNSIVSMKVLNNRDIATGSAENYDARIWSSTSKATKFTLSGPAYVFGIVEIQNGSLLTMSNQGFIRTWDSSTGTLINSRKPGSYSLKAIAYLRNEDLLIGDSNGGLRIYDPTTFELKYNLVGHTNAINHLIQLNNGDLASCSDDRTVRIWDWNTKNLKYTLSAYMSRGLIELQNGYVVSGGLDFKLIVWK